MARRYTVEEVERRFAECMAEIAAMMDSCDGRDGLGIVYSFADVGAVARPKGGGGGAAAAVSVSTEWFGNQFAAVCALVALKDRNRDIADIADHAQAVTADFPGFGGGKDRH